MLIRRSCAGGRHAWAGQASRRLGGSRIIAAAAAIELLEPRRLFTGTSLSPIADATVESNSADSNVANENFGADTTLVTANTGALTANSYIKFDLRSLSGTAINQAVLQVQELSTGSAPQQDAVSVFTEPDSFWAEGSGTFASPGTDGIAFNNPR